MQKLPLRVVLAVVMMMAVSYPQQIHQEAGSALNDVIRTLFSAREFDQVAISPDGKQVAWVEALVNSNGVPTGKSAIYVSAVTPGAAAKRITAGDGENSYAEQSISWSPDSRWLAFLSDAPKAGQQQLCAESVVSGTARRLTNVKGFLDAPRWSPDGKTLALLFTEDSTRAAGPLVAESPQTGVIKESVTEQRLSLVDLAGGQLRLISPADMYIYEYDWSPDGKRFAVTAAHGNGDDNWYVAQLYTLRADGAELKSIYKPGLWLRR